MLGGGRRVDVVTSTVTPLKSVGGVDVYSNKMSSQETVIKNYIIYFLIPPPFLNFS